VHYWQRFTDVDGNRRAVNPRIGAQMTQSHVRCAIYKTTESRVKLPINMSVATGTTSLRPLGSNPFNILMG